MFHSVKLVAAGAAMLLAVADTAPPPAVERLPRELPGPVAARVVGVIDGDTIVVRALPWLGMEIETAVRLAGIDAPELSGKCEREKSLAAAARDLLFGAVGDGRVLLRDVKLGKFAGRVVAVVENAEGIDLAELLLRSGLVRAYDGGPRQGWCD